MWVCTEHVSSLNDAHLSLGDIICLKSPPQDTHGFNVNVCQIDILSGLCLRHSTGVFLSSDTNVLTLHNVKFPLVTILPHRVGQKIKPFSTSVSHVCPMMRLLLREEENKQTKQTEPPDTLISQEEKYTWLKILHFFFKFWHKHETAFNKFQLFILQSLK